MLRATVIGLALLGLLAVCASDDQTFTCTAGRLVEPEEDADQVGLRSGLYHSRQSERGVAAGCFEHGRQLGHAEVACEIIDRLSDPDSGYTLLFTDDGGDTYPVEVARHVLLGPDAYSLESLALKYPFLSACPFTVPPID